MTCQRAEAKLLLKLAMKTGIQLRCIVYGLETSSTFVQRVKKEEPKGKTVVLTYASFAHLIKDLTVDKRLFVDCAMFAFVADLAAVDIDRPFVVPWPLFAAPIADIPDNIKLLKTLVPPYADDLSLFYHRLACLHRSVETDGEHRNMWLANDDQSTNYIGIREKGDVASKPLADWVHEWGKERTVICAM